MFCFRLNRSGYIRQQRIQVGQGIGEVVEIIKLVHLRINEFGHKIRAECPAWVTTGQSTDWYKFDKLGSQNLGTEISGADF